MKFPLFPIIILVLISLSLPACNMHRKEPQQEDHKIVVTSPLSKPIIVTKQYVCQIHSQRHTKIRTLERGYLDVIPVKEGQTVKKGDVLFKVIPVIYQAKLDAELAEQDLAQMQYEYTKKLSEEKVHPGILWVVV